MGIATSHRRFRFGSFEMDEIDGGYVKTAQKSGCRSSRSKSYKFCWNGGWGKALAETYASGVHADVNPVSETTLQSARGKPLLRCELYPRRVSALLEFN